MTFRVLRDVIPQAIVKFLDKLVDDSIRKCAVSRKKRIPASTSLPRPCARIALVSALPLLASCLSITVEPRALIQRPAGGVEVRTLACGTVSAA